MIIKKSVVLQVLNAALATGGDLAEIYYQDSIVHKYVLNYKKVDLVSSSKQCGVGIRILKGKKYVYGYTSDLSSKALISLASSLALGFEGERIKEVKSLKEKKHGNINPIKIPHSAWTTEQKLAYLKKGEEAAYNHSSKIQNYTGSLFEEDEHVEIYNSNGLFVQDDRVRTRLAVSVTATDGKQFQEAYFAPGLSKGLELLEDTDIVKMTIEACDTAIELLTAEDSPSGNMPVVLGNAFGGVLFHEACGHPLEGSAIYRASSPFYGKLNQSVASKVVSAYDDGTIPNGWGSENIDDEGNEPTRNELIKDGVLTNYMVDEFTSRSIENSKPTGSCRRESYRYAPTTRMTNTFIASGDSDPQDIIASVKDGIYCKDFAGGQVDQSTDQFVFTSTTAYRIKDGKITHMIKPVSLVGYGYEILPKITMVGNDIQRAPGVCGASSGSCYVEVGQPTLLISSILVGGAGGK